MTLKEHLLRYGIRHFDTATYWEWARKTLGEETAEEVEQLRQDLILSDWASEASHRFYERIATRQIAPILHSMKTDAIRASGEAVSDKLAGKQRVLDLGCGLGYLTTWYASLDERRRVLGIDSSQATILEARRIAEELAIPNVAFHCSDITQSLPQEGFDAVVDTQTLQDIEERADVLKKIGSVLNSDGLLVSVSALPEAEDAKRFARELEEPGLGLASVDFIYYLDCGEPGAFAVIEARAGEKSLRVDYDDQYKKVLENLCRA